MLFSIFNKELIFDGNCAAVRTVMDCLVELTFLRGLITGVLLTLPFSQDCVCVRSVEQFAYVSFLLLWQTNSGNSYRTSISFIGISQLQGHYLGYKSRFSVYMWSFLRLLPAS